MRYGAQIKSVGHIPEEADVVATPEINSENFKLNGSSCVLGVHGEWKVETGGYST